MSDQDKPLYPLKFEPIYKPKIWGGRSLKRLGRMLPGDDTHRIGESWELVDLGQTSTSGGGGGQERSVVTNGPLAGRTLNAVIQQYREGLLGRLPLTADDGFPLLVKFLDAGENLSVQVHPDEVYAQAHADAFLKSEAWYIVDAAPGAVIYKGVREGVTPQQFRDAIDRNTDDAVEPLLIKVPVKPGDCHYLPSGTCHALGKGILVAEVQTPSDTTFRVYDWGRTDRELHIDPAMACIRFGPPEMGDYEKRSHIAGVYTTVTRLVTCEHFRIDKVRMSQGYQQEIPYDQPAVWIVLEGSGRICLGEGAAETEGLSASADSANEAGDGVRFGAGQTLLLPAGMDQAKVILDQDTVWLEVTFPKAMSGPIA